MSSVRAEIRRALIIARTRERRVTATCQVDQAEAARYFDQHPGRFEEPEQLHVYAITVGVDPSSPAQEWKAARAKAETLRGELAAGASFSELAEKHSTDPSRAQGGDMGWFHRGSLMPQFETVAKDLPLGRVSDVIDTLYGYHLIRVTEIRPARRLAFSEVSDRLAKDLTETRCKEVSDAWLGRLRSSATIVFPR
jgi:peptidyl-prolyl cis-trans isomerase C